MPVRLNMRYKGKSLPYDTKKPGRTSKQPPASIEQYRGNVDLSSHIGSLGTITSTAGLYLNENAVSSSGA